MKVWEGASAHTEGSVRRVKRWCLPPHSGKALLYFQVSSEGLWPLLSPTDSLYPWGDSVSFCMLASASLLRVHQPPSQAHRLTQKVLGSERAQPARLWGSLSRGFLQSTSVAVADHRDWTTAQMLQEFLDRISVISRSTCHSVASPRSKSWQVFETAEGQQASLKGAVLACFWCWHNNSQK